jgi:hypothetical protein
MWSNPTVARLTSALPTSNWVLVEKQSGNGGIDPSRKDIQRNRKEERRVTETPRFIVGAAFCVSDIQAGKLRVTFSWSSGLRAFRSRISIYSMSSQISFTKTHPPLNYDRFLTIINQILSVYPFT